MSQDVSIGEPSLAMHLFFLNLVCLFPPQRRQKPRVPDAHSPWTTASIASHGVGQPQSL
jgi:hypothetical protein